MKRLMIVALAGLLVVTGVHADSPGVLDGQDIPSDFAYSKLVGLQTNRTGVGDVTDLKWVASYTEGSELDALYLARDSSYLYVGLAGNLLQVGNPFVVFIDSDFDYGQTELRTEGVNGPPFALQLAGREVQVNTNGTADGSDDTYTVVPDSGMILPTCGDPYFTGWDYALAVDGALGVMYAHEYILFDFAIDSASAADVCHFGDDRGRVPCDPTPDNPNDSGLPVYAIRTHVAESPIGDWNEIFEGGEASAGYQRGGFININTTGVTETESVLADATTSGVEIAIPLANIGPSGLYGNETIHLLVLTLDADEYQESELSEGFGTVLNQALPSFVGDSCDPASGLGMRPDLSTVASCLSVDLSTLSYIDTAAVLEGDIVASDYATGAPMLTQQCPTSGGDQARESDILRPDQEGSELDALYVDNDDEYLYVGLTGNLQGDDSSINVFVDVDGKGSGDAVLSNFSNFAFSGVYEQWETATFTPGENDIQIQTTDFGGAWYYIDPMINAEGATKLTLDLTINAANQADTVRVVLTDEDLTERAYHFAIPGPGTYSLSLPIDSYSEEPAPGGIPGLDLSKLNFFHITGGMNNGDPGVVFDVTVDHLALADDDLGQHVLNFDPGPEAYTSTLITGFGDFDLDGRYGSWSSADITSGPSDYRIVAETFGGGYYDISPNVNAAGGIAVEFKVTLNEGTSEGGVLLVLSDDDGTEHRWSWFGLTVGEYTLTADLAHGDQVVVGGEPGLDLTQLSYFHIQGDFPTADLTFDNLAIIGVQSGVSPILTMNGNELANGQLDPLNNGRYSADTPVQYDYAYGINLSYMPHLAYVDYFDLVNNTFAFRGAVVPESGNSELSDDAGGQIAENPNGMAMAFSNWNTNGVIGCGNDEPCFQTDAETVAAMAEQATTGVELAIPLADLGLDASDLPRVVNLWTMIGSRQGYSSDQSLPSMRNVSGTGNQVTVPGDAPVNFTTPNSGPDSGAVITDFSDFALHIAYSAWSDGTFTSGPDDFRVQATDYGGGLRDLNPDIDASGATSMVLNLTLNPANETDKVVVILVDADGTERVFRFDDLTNGTHSLVRDLSTFNNDNNPGSVAGLDLSAISLFHIQGAYHNGDPGVTMDVTFDHLELIGGLRNYEARAARVCLGTVAGDPDCDGDNDLEDFALLQQCLGIEASPVLPMECEQLDFDKDRQVDDQDIADFVSLLDGP